MTPIEKAARSWGRNTSREENPPVGLILCASRDKTLAKYALEGLPNKVLAAEYRTALPDEATIVEELEHTRQELELRSRPGARKRKR